MKEMYEDYSRIPLSLPMNSSFSTASSSLTTLFPEEICHSHIDVDNLDANEEHRAFVPIDHTLIQTLLEKAASIRLVRLSLLKLDCICPKSIGWRSHSHHADQWREMVQRAEMGDDISMKVSQQRQNTTYFDLNRPWPYS
jgi:hypothetical protein